VVALKAVYTERAVTTRGLPDGASVTPVISCATGTLLPWPPLPVPRCSTYVVLPYLVAVTTCHISQPG
jgi:hypothetical protein